MVLVFLMSERHEFDPRCALCTHDPDLVWRTEMVAQGVLDNSPKAPEFSDHLKLGFFKLLLLIFKWIFYEIGG